MFQFSELFIKESKSYPLHIANPQYQVSASAY